MVDAVSTCSELSMFFYSMLFFSFWKIFCCCCEPLGKSLLNLSHYCFCFMLSFFWPWGMWGLSSPTRDWTHTPGIRRWSLNHWTTTEVPHSYSYYCILYCYWWHLRQKPRNPLVSLLCNQLSNSDCLSFFFFGVKFYYDEIHLSFYVFICWILTYMHTSM